MKKYIVRSFLAGFLTLVPATAAQAQLRDIHKPELNKSSPSVLAAFRDVVKKPSECTVHVLCEGREVALGTIVEADGWVLTKASELTVKPICKLKDGRQLPATVVGVHEPCDLALLKVEVKGLKVVEWSEGSPTLGRWLASVGPDDDALAVGVVSVLTRQLPPGRQGPDLSQSGYMGVAFDQADGSPKVSQVMPGGGAEKAGVKTEDVVLAIGDDPVDSTQAFMNAIQKHKPGDIVPLHIKRGDKELDVKVTLGKRPVDRGDFMNRLGGELSNRRANFPEVLQHDTVLKPSECGGPVVDLDGKAIGVNIARAGRTESYALPGELVRKLLPELKSGKLAPKPKEESPAKRAALEQKLTETKTALERLEAEKSALEKKLAEARTAKEKAEAELAAEKARLKEKETPKEQPK